MTQEEQEIHALKNTTNKTFKIIFMTHDLLQLLYHSLSLTLKLSSNSSTFSQLQE